VRHKARTAAATAAPSGASTTIEEAGASCNDEQDRKYIAYLDAEKSTAVSSMLSVLEDHEHDDRIATYESVFFEEEVSLRVHAEVCAGGIGTANNTNATMLAQVGFVADQDELAELMKSTDRRGFLNESNVLRSQNDGDNDDVSQDM
jgi:hypothetical protein